MKQKTSTKMRRRNTDRLWHQGEISTLQLKPRRVNKGSGMLFAIIYISIAVTSSPTLERHSLLSSKSISPGHPLRQICNKNTIKIGYSCTIWSPCSSGRKTIKSSTINLWLSVQVSIWHHLEYFLLVKRYSNISFNFKIKLTFILSFFQVSWLRGLYRKQNYMFIDHWLVDWHDSLDPS